MIESLAQKRLDDELRRTLYPRFDRVGLDYEGSLIWAIGNNGESSTRRFRKDRKLETEADHIALAREFESILRLLHDDIGF